MLEGERMAALEAAAAAGAEVSQLKEEQRRLHWQSQLLEKMSEVGERWKYQRLCQCDVASSSSTASRA